VERTRADQAMMDLNTGLPFETVIKTKQKTKTVQSSSLSLSRWNYADPCFALGFCL
jgi:hypothetical protein